MKQIFNAILSPLANILFPFHCLHCRSIIDNHSLWCADCAINLTPCQLKPHCPQCGLIHQNPECRNNDICATCRHHPPAYDNVYACYYYDDMSKHAIISLKHYDQTYLAAQIAIYMQRMLSTVINDADAIIPIPLHHKRLRQRKFNQSLLIAQHLAKHNPNVQIYENFLQRHRDTPSQGLLSGKQRWQNVRSAFSMNKDKALSPHHRHIILLDDVMTSGASVGICASLLRQQYPDSHISILCFLRADNTIISS